MGLCRQHGHFSQFGCPPAQDRSAAAAQLVIPELQLVPLRVAVTNALEEVVTLLEHPLVSRAGGGVLAIDLGEGDIDEMAAPRGRPGDQVEVVGCEENGSEA